jgi:transaldolase
MSLKEDINFSLWCDFIERDFLENHFQDLVKDEVIQGATSNPAIFATSISNSVAYRQQLEILQANTAKTIYEEVAMSDIKRAAEILEPMYKNDSDDGFISLEVDPTLCDDSEGTIEEGIRLYKTIGHDNVMIKVPATQAGYVAMEELTSQGINVNATLIFSPEQAINCSKALNAGMEKSITECKAVVSIFVSRFDRLCDNKFGAKGIEKSKLGIINAVKCYHEINKIGNNNIRTLFASTGVKGDELEATYYVDNLLYPNSVNTAPLATIEDYLLSGSTEPSKIISEDECDEFFKMLVKHDVDINEIYETLLTDGLESFKVSFEELLSKLKV